MFISDNEYNQMANNSLGERIDVLEKRLNLICNHLGIDTEEIDLDDISMEDLI